MLTNPVPALALLALAGLTAGCGKAGPLFVESSAACGIDVVLTSGGDPDVKQTILEVNGNGVALSDLDGDGDLDIVLVDGSTPSDFLAGSPVHHHVLVNIGNHEGRPRFEPLDADVTGLVMAGWPTGIAVGDVDQDGRPDLLIGGLGEDVLFLNRTGPEGPIRFEPRPLPGRHDVLDWTTSTGLADADGDGRLDAYLVRYLFIDPADPPLGDVGGLACRFEGHPVMCGPQGLPPQPDVFLAGTEPLGTFTVATAAARLDTPPPSYGLGLLFADLDLDGWPDLYVANDSMDNFLLSNQGNGTFADMTALSGAASDLSGRAQAGMGVALGDANGDGHLDIAVTNFSDETNALYSHIGPMQYRDMTAAAGVAARSRPMLGWGIALADFNADGHIDLFVSNGHVFPEADRPGTGTAYAQPLQLFLGHTGDESEAGGWFGPDVFPDPTAWRGRAAARGDLDGDGDLDLVVLVLDGVPRVYLNQVDEPRRQLLVTLSDGVREAFGATLTIRLASGIQVRQKLASEGFQTANDPRLHFATPQPALIQSASVLWPGGEVEQLDPASLTWGHHLVIEKGRGVATATALERVR